MGRGGRGKEERKNLTGEREKECLADQSSYCTAKCSASNQLLLYLCWFFHILCSNVAGFLKYVLKRQIRAHLKTNNWRTSILRWLGREIVQNVARTRIWGGSHSTPHSMHQHCSILLPLLMYHVKKHILPVVTCDPKNCTYKWFPEIRKQLQCWNSLITTMLSQKTFDHNTVCGSFTPSQN